MKNNQEICDIAILVSKRDYIGNEIVLCEDKEGYYIPCSDEAKREAIKNKEVRELYILSSDPILRKEDYTIERVNNVINKCIFESWKEDQLYKKVIATTDNQLIGVPKLSSATIRDFVLYNIKDSFKLRVTFYKNELIFDWIY